MLDSTICLLVGIFMCIAVCLYLLWSELTLYIFGMEDYFLLKEPLVVVVVVISVL